MSNPTLEVIPPEVLVEVIQCLPEYKDLLAIIRTSIIFYRLFKVYESSILRQIALNILGPECWNDATAVLVYQRDNSRSTPDFAAIEKDLGSKFVLTKNDITQLFINQDFYEGCALDFSAFLSQPNVCPNCGGDHHDIPQGDTKYSFTAGDTLSMRMFYKVWLLDFQFGYDSITVFSNRPAHSKEEAMDLYFVSQIMYRNLSYFDVVRSPLGGKWCTGTLSFNMFSLFEFSKSLIIDLGGSNPMLLMKMLSHLAAITDPGDETIMDRFRARLKLFLLEYSTMSTEDLVKKYKLEECEEFSDVSG